MVENNYTLKRLGSLEAVKIDVKLGSDEAGDLRLKEQGQRLKVKGERVGGFKAWRL
jgi:hypothetical protein